jgi:hypothetical protein
VDICIPDGEHDDIRHFWQPGLAVNVRSARDVRIALSCEFHRKPIEDA